METQRNRALTDVIEPGSTFKIVPAAAALNEGIVEPSEIFETGEGRVEYKVDHFAYPTIIIPMNRFPCMILWSSRATGARHTWVEARRTKTLRLRAGIWIWRKNRL